MNRTVWIFGVLLLAVALTGCATTDENVAGDATTATDSNEVRATAFVLPGGQKITGDGSYGWNFAGAKGESMLRVKNNGDARINSIETGALIFNGEWRAYKVTDTVREGETRTYVLGGEPHEPNLELTVVYVDAKELPLSTKISMNGQLTGLLNEGSCQARALPTGPDVEICVSNIEPDFVEFTVEMLDNPGVYACFDQTTGALYKSHSPCT